MEARYNKKLAQKVLRMAAADQQLRKNFHAGRQSWNPTIDRRNTRELKRIIARYNWPTTSLVGRKAAHAAWLLAQHSDHDTRFQEHVLRAMYKLYERSPKEVLLQDIAYLQDRLLVNRKRRQLFGTQFHKTRHDTFEPFPIRDKSTLNARRKAFRLSSIEQYVKLIRAIHRKMGIRAKVLG